MSDNGKRDSAQDDLTDAGFIKLDEHAIHRQHPPKIHWGKLYKQRSPEEKLAFAEKLAASMNFAASIIQTERDELGMLCEKKEEQLIKMNEMMRQNNMMLQEQVTKFNSQRQGYNAEVARLNQRIRDLEHGN